jgi:hypothetical protein
MAKKPVTEAIIDGLELVKSNDVKKKPETKTAATKQTDSERIIELLEAIDWKLWVMYNKFSDEEM